MRLWYTQLRPRLWRATMATNHRLTEAYRANQHWRHALAAIGMALLAACGSSFPPATGQPRRAGKSNFSHLSLGWRLMFNLEQSLMERYSSHSYVAQAVICVALAFLSAAGFNINDIPPTRQPGAR